MPQTDSFGFPGQKNEHTGQLEFLRTQEYLCLLSQRQQQIITANLDKSINQLKRLLDEAAQKLREEFDR